MALNANTLVSVSWLKEHLNDENLIVLDATIPKVTAVEEQVEAQQIPGARFLDLKTKFSDGSARFPNTLPSTAQFNQEAQNLGINTNSVIVVYDQYGFYSSARAWWLFKAFGHEQVAVLDGGLPEWKEAGFPLVEQQESNYKQGNFSGTLNSTFFQFFTGIETLKNNPEFLILDARSRDRFYGLLPEPHEGLRSGHIPNSANLPFQQLLVGNTMKSPAALKRVFQTFNPHSKPMVFSCGSGVTACILALGAELAGYTNLSVYDGSWTEYGTLTTLNMDNPKQWSKEELLAYILLFVAHSDLDETQKEKEYILSRVDKNLYKRVHEKFDEDNDYQSIQNIIEAVDAHDYYQNDLADLFADIKLMAFADGQMDQMEQTIYNYLKKILK